MPRRSGLIRQLLIVALGLFLCSSGCGPGSTRGSPLHFSSAQSHSKTAVSNQDKGWVKHYCDKQSVFDSSEIEDDVWNFVAADGALRCIFDERLSMVAREHAKTLSQKPTKNSDADIDRLRFTLHKHGGTDYSIGPLAVRGDSDEKLGSLARLAHKRGKKWTHCGVGVHGLGEDAHIVWIGVHRVIDLDPLPVMLATRASINISGRVLSSPDALVQPFVGLPNGSVQRLPSIRTNRHGRFSVRVSLMQIGRNEIELMVDTGSGPETAMLVPVFLATTPDPRPTVAPQIDDAEQSAPLMLLKYLNTARKKAGVPLFTSDPRLSKISQAHSDEMVKKGFFGHISPFSGSLSTRLEAADLHPYAFAENLARSGSVLHIHRNLMSSPSHRINSLNKEFTHVGIGVAMDGDDLVVTQIFGRWHR